MVLDQTSGESSGSRDMQPRVVVNSEHKLMIKFHFCQDTFTLFHAKQLAEIGCRSVLVTLSRFRKGQE